MSNQTAPMANDGSSWVSLKRMMSGPLDFMINETRENGPIFRIKLSKTYITFISNQWVEKLLEQEDTYLIRKDLFNTFESETGIDIFSLQGDAHHKFKKATALPFSRFLSSQFIHVMDKTNNEFLDRCGEKTDLITLTRHISVASMMAITSPHDLNDLTESLLPFSDHAMYVLTKQRPSFLLKWPTHLRRKKRIFDRLTETIQQHRDNPPKELYLIDACIKQGMDDKTIRSVCIYSLSGANAYIAKIVGFMLYEILRNETLKKNILYELSTLDFRAEDRATQFRNLPYFRATYYEVLRFYPILAGIVFKAKKDFSIDSIDIPEGETLVLAPHLRHFDEHFFPNPLTFDVERCLPNRAEHLNRYSYRPYGIGKRTCSAIGMNEVVILNTVANLLYRYKVDLLKITTKFNLKYNPLLGPDRAIEIQVKKRAGGELAYLKSISKIVSSSPDYSNPFSTGKMNILSYGHISDATSGETLIKEGEEADSFWVVLKGEVEVIRGGNRVNTLKAGQGFGERGLLTHSKRNATVKALTNCVLLKISAAGFDDIISTFDLDNNDIAHFVEREYFKKVFSKSFQGNEMDNINEIISGGIFEEFKVGDTIIKEGDPSDAFYMLISGDVEVTKNTGITTSTLANLGAGDFFGEAGIINSQPRSANIIAKNNCRVLKIPRDCFLDLLNDSQGFHRNIFQITSKRILDKLS